MIDFSVERLMFRCSDADLLVSRSDACIWDHTNMFSRIDCNEQPNEQVRDSLDDVIQLVSAVVCCPISCSGIDGHWVSDNIERFRMSSRNKANSESFQTNQTLRLPSSQSTAHINLPRHAAGSSVTRTIRAERWKVTPFAAQISSCTRD